jgi:primosomal protein N' (replication factor Y)
MTVHQHDRRLRCHHCGGDKPLPGQCPDCRGPKLETAGKGTEQLQQFLEQRFPGQTLVRIDRDSTRRKGSLEARLEQVHSGEARILIGTQMLAKGHHFPGVTLVGILGIDQALFSADFRGPEYMAQLVTQVAGRAGRADRPGQVLIETRHPDSPLLRRLIAGEFGPFAEAALAERRAAAMPPYTHLALIRAEAVTADTALAFLRRLAEQLPAQSEPAPVEVLGPVPAPMERRAGRYRAQLLLQSEARPPLHALLARLRERAGALPGRRKVRWSIDVDPVELL